jgi:hypothetical protein
LILWGLSAVFALVAIWISKPNGEFERWIVYGAGALWAVLFVFFFVTDDE